MRIGIVSDTHGELDNLREAVRQLLEGGRYLPWFIWETSVRISKFYMNFPNWI